MQTKPLPTTARVFTDHMKWFAQLNEAARAIADHVSSGNIADPKLQKLVEQYQELDSLKPR